MIEQMASGLNIEDTQYNMVQLPSRGECYRNKVSQLPVAYLTASDENIIFSETLLVNGRMCDVLLEKKVLDKSVNIGDLCLADREAILLWLRRTGYGDNYTYSDENGEEREIDLSTISFREFSQVGDEQGHFELTTNNGEVIKYRLLTRRDEIEISSFVEELNNSVIAGTDLSERDYYIQIANQILAHQVISVNGIDDIEEWLNGLGYENMKSIVEMLQENSPGISQEMQRELKLNEILFIGL